MTSSTRLRVIDSHTGGEPTRVVIEGAPVWPGLSMAACCERLRADHDSLRRAIVCEPRGSDVLVGAFLLPPSRPDCDAGVVFFNNVGYLGMCGHGTIGLVATLVWLGRTSPGRIALETPVGVVAATLHCVRENAWPRQPTRRLGGADRSKPRRVACYRGAIDPYMR